MITNERQLQITQRAIERFQAALDGDMAEAGVDALILQTQHEAAAEQLRELQAEVDAYLQLRSGKIREFHLPGGPGVRVDTAAYRDYVIPPHYDSLIAKLVVRGKDRAEVLARARRALEQFIIEGVKTSIPLHRAILDNAAFIAGNFSTRFMETFER